MDCSDGSAVYYRRDNRRKMKKQTFENFMQDQCPPELLGGGADGAQEGFENWVSDMDVEGVWEYAGLYGTQCYLEGKEEVLGKVLPNTANLKKLLQ